MRQHPMVSNEILFKVTYTSLHRFFSRPDNNLTLTFMVVVLLYCHSFDNVICQKNRRNTCSLISWNQYWTLGIAYARCETHCWRILLITQNVHFNGVQTVSFHVLASTVLTAVPNCLLTVFLPKYCSIVYSYPHAYLECWTNWSSVNKPPDPLVC